MNKYRKLYNANFLGTTENSLIKFYYASFKIQQMNGKITDIDEFLDICIDAAKQTSKYVKILGFLPFVSTEYSAELKRIAKFIEIRHKDVKAFFQKDDITDEEVEKLLYGITQEEAKSLSKRAEPIEKAKQYILKCYSIKGKKQLGDRIFGYLLKSEVIEAYTPAERKIAWEKLIGSQYTPSDTRLHANPKFNRSINQNDITTLSEHLQTLINFFNEIGLEKTADIVRYDLSKLQA